MLYGRTFVRTVGYWWIAFQTPRDTFTSTGLVAICELSTSGAFKFVNCYVFICVRVITCYVDGVSNNDTMVLVNDLFFRDYYKGCLIIFRIMGGVFAK